MTRVIGYARADGQGAVAKIDQQKRQISAYCSEFELPEPAEVFFDLCAEDVLDREQLKKALGQLKQGDKLVITNYDILTIDYKFYTSILVMFEAKKASLVSIDNNFAGSKAGKALKKFMDQLQGGPNPGSSG